MTGFCFGRELVMTCFLTQKAFTPHFSFHKVIYFIFSQMDLMREKERAQRERARMRTEEKNVHIPVFSPPRRVGILYLQCFTHL
jgi:hypothetical protein